MTSKRKFIDVVMKDIEKAKLRSHAYRKALNKFKDKERDAAAIAALFYAPHPYYENGEDACLGELLEELMKKVSSVWRVIVDTEGVNIDNREIVARSLVNVIIAATTALDCMGVDEGERIAHIYAANIANSSEKPCDFTDEEANRLLKAIFGPAEDDEE